MSKAQSPPLTENILIVDDSPDSLHLLARILSRQGYKVRCAPDGELALEFAQVSPPDLILLDIMMPQMDGYQVCKKLKASSGTKDIPVIFISALHEVFDKVKALALGGIDYITKPFQVEEVLARVQNQLRIRWLTQQLLEQNARITEEIEERKQAEEELRKSEQQFRSIFENASVGIALVDLDGYLLTANEANCRFLGYSPEELVGLHFSVFTHPDDLALDTDLFPCLLRGEIHSYTIDKRSVRKDRAIVWGRLTLSVIKHEHGTPRYITIVCEDITDRKRTEEELRKSEERLQLALSGSGMGLWDWTVTTGEVYFSPEWKTMLGYEVQEIENSTQAWERLVHPEDLPRAWEAMNAHWEGRSPRYTAEFRMLSKDGEWKWILSIAKVMEYDASGKPLRVTGTHRDISEQKLAKAALQQSEERWQLALKGNNEGIWDLNLKTNQVFRSARYKEIMGYEDHELGDDNDDWAGRVHPDDFDRVMQANQDYLDRKIPHYAVEYRLRCKDGSYKWVLGRAQAVWDETGKPVRMVGSTTDISDAYRQAAQRKLAEAALAESERKYRNLVETSQDMIYSLDVEGRFTFVNSAVKQIYGYEPSEMIGRPFTDFVAPEQIAQDLNLFQRLLQGESVFQYETTHLAKDGKPIQLMFNAISNACAQSAIALRDSQGNVLGTTGTASDITERKQREEALQLIVEGTASATDTAFMRSCVRYLAQALQVRYALIAEVADDSAVVASPGASASTRVRTLAFWTGETWSENFEYNLAGTPFENLLQEKACLYPQEVQALFTSDSPSKTLPFGFPFAVRDRDLVQLGVQSYLGIPLINSNGNVIGLLVVLDVKPMVRGFGKESILKIFAARAAVELERKQAETALRHSETRFREKAQELELTIDQLKQTQAQLLLTDKMASLGQLVAGIAHEINNPVSFIYANITPAVEYTQDLLHILQLYRRHYPQPVAEIREQFKTIEIDFIAEDFPKLLASMRIGAERICQIVLSLRNFSHLDEAEKKRVDIHEGIDNTLLILQHRLKQQPHRPEIQVIKEYGELPTVECFPGQLNQVFMNIINNAIDALEGLKVDKLLAQRGVAQVESWEDNLQHSNLQHSNLQHSNLQHSNLQHSNLQHSNLQHSNLQHSNLQHSTAQHSTAQHSTAQHSTPWIRIHTSVVERDWVVIRIADNGAGIKAEVLSRIFDPFFTTKPVGSGTGLGLSISYRIVVDRHGGQMTCHSVAGQGTEFAIKLPIAQGKIHSSKAASHFESVGGFATIQKDLEG
jgi:PAS domain S-box-containing protein